MRPGTISKLALPHVRELKPYTPGTQPSEPGWIKLNTNENPYPPSPSVEEALKGAMAGDALRLYPNPRSERLREAIAALHGVSPEQALVGNGSDDVLNLLARAFVKADQGVAYTLPSYSLYPVLCAVQDAGPTEIPFDRSMRLPIDAMCRSGARIIFLTSPNAPTGVGFSNREISRFLDRFEGLLVLDEAYADFAEENAMELLSAYPNLFITRTFSKSYALAGLRLGYGVGSAEVVSLLDRVRDSYNVNRLSQAAGLAAIRDQSYLSAVAGKIRWTRDFYREELEKRGWFTYPSQANFLFTEPKNGGGESGPEVASALFEYLRERKILVRYFPGHALTASFLRISVGDEDQMLALSETIDRWLKNA